MTKFPEAALFRVTVSPSGRIRDGIRQGRADARLVRGMWLGKTTESDGRADLVKSLQGTPWDRLAGRPGKTLQNSSSSTARCDTSSSQSS